MNIERERAAFEWWASDEGESPWATERAGGCYKLAQIQSYWMAWQARAALQAECEKLRKDVAGLLICDECHDKCADPYTGLFASHCPDEEPCIMCECSSLRRQLAEQQPALAAAAPELLYALMELADWYREHTGLPPTAANAAIAKATGGQP